MRSMTVGSPPCATTIALNAASASPLRICARAVAAASCEREGVRVCGHEHELRAAAGMPATHAHTHPYHAALTRHSCGNHEGGDLEILIRQSRGNHAAITRQSRGNRAAIMSLAHLEVTEARCLRSLSGGAVGRSPTGVSL